MTDNPCEDLVKELVLASCPHLDSPVVSLETEGAVTPSESTTPFTINWRECHPKHADLCRYNSDGDPECCYQIYTADGKVSHYEWQEPIDERPY